MLFSQRKGLKPVKSVLQTDSMDNDLRAGLWNSLCISCWQGVDASCFYSQTTHSATQLAYRLCQAFWLHYFKWPVDTLGNWRAAYDKLRKYFFSCPWNETYDFIEFVAGAYEDEIRAIMFQQDCNMILERELSGYRFVDGRIAPITSSEEIGAIEEATQCNDPLRPVAAHFKRALGLLSDRKSPDYRNSIKESISGIEATCKIFTRKSKAELTDALRELKKKIEVHPALEKAFVQMYGYTSDEHGIRHALMDEPQLGFEDAKFMLVCCAAFANYLTAKAAKQGSAEFL